MKSKMAANENIMISSNYSRDATWPIQLGGSAEMPQTLLYNRNRRHFLTVLQIQTQPKSQPSNG